MSLLVEQVAEGVSIVNTTTNYINPPTTQIKYLTAHMYYGSSSLDAANSGLLGILASGSPFTFNAYDNTVFTPNA